MKIVVQRVIALCVIVLIVWQAWTHRHLVTLSTLIAPEAKTADKPPGYVEQQQANRMVTIVGPLSDLFKTEKAADKEDEEKERPDSQEIMPSDHVGPSAIGTAAVLLHRTFRVRRVVDQPFDLPPHAFNPQLRGHYRGFQQGVEGAANETASVQFLLLSEEQYANFISGHPAEALLTADGSDEQEISFRMPPTFEQPARYHMVFKNDSGASRQVVQADFRVDF